MLVWLLTAGFLTKGWTFIIATQNRNTLLKVLFLLSQGHRQPLNKAGQREAGWFPPAQHLLLKMQAWVGVCVQEELL